MTVEDLANLLVADVLETHGTAVADDPSRLEWLWLPHEIVVFAATHGAFILPAQAEEARDLFVKIMGGHSSERGDS
jgi:hypothetical protein